MNPNDPVSLLKETKYNYNTLHYEYISHIGIDARTYVATCAMQGIMSSNECGVGHHPETVAEWSVNIADALLLKLNK